MLKTALKGKFVLVLGLGLSGQAAVSFLLRRGARVVGADSKIGKLVEDASIAELCAEGMKAIHDGASCDINEFDLLVVSPGIPTTHPYYQEALRLGVEIIGEVELACREIKKPCVGITGTNGKTTVTSMIAHILNHSGKKARALGNIGTPLTTAIDQEIDADIYIIELSSFQLETLHTRFLDCAVILNITPDHLDRYASMNDYAQAKINIKNNLKVGGKLFLEERCLSDFSSQFTEEHYFNYGYDSMCYMHTDLERMFLDGKSVCTLPQSFQHKRSHEVENLLAAFLLCTEMGITSDQFLDGFKTFKKPSHRIEFVTSIDGVEFYDDSKGTNIDAVIRAVESLSKLSVKENIILIAGGVDKGAPYTPWLDVFKGHVKAICAIGQAAPKMHNELKSQFQIKIHENLDAAVQHAFSLAKRGDIVLLSPGCSSFDMFKDYAHRGQEFQRIVNELYSSLSPSALSKIELGDRPEY